MQPSRKDRAPPSQAHMERKWSLHYGRHPLLGVLSIVELHARNLVARGQRELHRRLAVEVDLLAHQLISAMLARRLDKDGVLTWLYRIALIVFPVPSQRVLSRRPGRRRDAWGKLPAEPRHHRDRKS